jgi:hypothetical protein
VNRYAGLGFDPAPGTVDSVRALAERFAEAGRLIADAAGRCTDAMATSDAWRGAAAEEFRRRVAALPTRLHGQQDTVTAAAEVLFAWATTLADLQRQAERYDRQARGLLVRIADAEQLVDEWDTAVSVASTHVRPRAEATLAVHQATLAGLRAELDAVRAAARTLAADHRRAAADTAARLRSPVMDQPTTRRRLTVATDIGALLADLTAQARRATAMAALATWSGPRRPPAGGLGTTLAALAATGTDSATTWTFGEM